MRVLLMSLVALVAVSAPGARAQEDIGDPKK
jgi:hypothetical protein